MNGVTNAIASRPRSNDFQRTNVKAIASRKKGRESLDLKQAQKAAIRAAQLVGELMRRNLAVHKRANSATQHDIKLELDVRSQNLIQKTRHSFFPQAALLGEEGVAGDPGSL